MRLCAVPQLNGLSPERGHVVLSLVAVAERAPNVANDCGPRARVDVVAPDQVCVSLHARAPTTSGTGQMLCATPSWATSGLILFAGKALCLQA